MKKIQFSERTSSSVRIFLGEDDYTDYGFFVSFEDIIRIFGEDFGAQIISGKNCDIVANCVESKASIADIIEEIKRCGTNPFYKKHK